MPELRGKLKTEKLKGFFSGFNRKKLPLILGVAATALVVLAAAVLPALLIPPHGIEAPEQPAAPGERAALFSRFWYEDAALEVILLDRAAFTEAELMPSGERIRALHDTFLFDDAAPSPESSGEHFYILRGEDGVTLRMREFYEQSTGDWSNWFRVFTDIDGDEIYFFYQSCKCLQNEENYDFVDLSARALSEGWAETLGATGSVWLGSAGSASRAVYVVGGEALYYDVSYTSYTTPEFVVDFRFVMKPPPA
jgi:hypothetical protein